MTAALRTLTAFTYNATTASSEAVAANANRQYLLLINDSDTVLYLAFGEAAVANKGLRLAASGGSYEMSREAGNMITSNVRVIHGGSGNKVLCGLES